MKALRSTWVRVGVLTTIAVIALGAGVQRARHQPPPGPEPTVVPATQIDPDAVAGAPRGAAEEAAAGASRPARVPDIPLAWRRIADSAKGWPKAGGAPLTGEQQPVPTVPASRMRDTLGVNIDVWRTEYGYRDFTAVVAKTAELQLRHARAPVSAVDGPGLARMQALGAIGVRWNVLLGDAFGRFQLAPFATLDRRLHDVLLPYVDSVEGTNEPDLAKREDWVARTREHQRKIVEAVAPERGDPLAVVAPAMGRLPDVAVLGNLTGFADASNAHAYAGGDEPGQALDDWLALVPAQLPGAPMVVTEAGFQDDLRQRKYHTPTSPQAAAVYTPRLLLEAMRRGIPRVYLYELIDRWDDPFGVDTAAHFGLLTHDLKPKPAWRSLVRLQRALLDGGRPDREVRPLLATLQDAPRDTQLLALRRRDGSLNLVLWRTAPVWNPEAAAAIEVPAEPVRLRLPQAQDGVETLDVVSGARARLAPAAELTVPLGGNPVVISGLRD